MEITIAAFWIVLTLWVAYGFKPNRAPSLPPLPPVRFITRGEALKRDYLIDQITQETLEEAAEALAQLGLLDERCPYTVEGGHAWWDQIPTPRMIVPFDGLPLRHTK